ncbi:MAG TPA: LysM peptidoglycan-binding domain-containing protein [Opitutus sp.]|nr:LysM peptidoglycan-binding domain-containing protein [Opitutus sp.]
MLKRLLLGCALAASASAQSSSVQIEVANLREDVRGLGQRVGELSLRVEQLERENRELRNQRGTAERNYVTLVQLQEAVENLNQKIRGAAAETKSETLQQVSAQMEILAKQTNAAIDSLAKGMATRAPVQTNFASDYPKEGISYTVQKGDTLAEIAKKTGAKLADIVNANHLTDPSHIVVGQTLFIPGGK